MEKIPQTLSKVIDVLSQKFGATGAHLYSVLVRQSYVDAVGWFGWALALMLISLTLAICCHRCFLLATDSENCDVDAGVVGAWVCGSFALIVSFIAIGCAVSGLELCLNPEYYAITTILSSVPR